MSGSIVCDLQHSGSNLEHWKELKSLTNFTTLQREDWQPSEETKSFNFFSPSRPSPRHSLGRRWFKHLNLQVSHMNEWKCEHLKHFANLNIWIRVRQIAIKRMILRRAGLAWSYQIKAKPNATEVGSLLALPWLCLRPVLAPDLSSVLAFRAVLADLLEAHWEFSPIKSANKLYWQNKNAAGPPKYLEIIKFYTWLLGKTS